MPSRSPLLRLPSEVRTLIFEELLNNDEQIYVWENSDKQLRLFPIDQSPLENLALPMDLPRTRGRAIDLGFMLACRQIYAETDYLLYMTKTFCFHHPATLLRFSKGLTAVQKLNIRSLHLAVHAPWFESPKLQGPWHSCSLYNALNVSLGLRDLTGLQLLDLRIHVKYSKERALLAQSVHHILKRVDAHCAVNVVLNEGTLIYPYKSQLPKQLKRIEPAWDTHRFFGDTHRVFADTVSARIRDPWMPLPTRS